MFIMCWLESDYTTDNLITTKCEEEAKADIEKEKELKRERERVGFGWEKKKDMVFWEGKNF